MRSVPNILPSVKFPNVGKFPVFPAFPVFLRKKKEENQEKKLFYKNGPNSRPGAEVCKVLRAACWTFL